MAKLVEPYTVHTQKRGESVIYELPWATWNEDLQGIIKQTITFVAVDSGPATMRVLGDRPSVSRVLMTSWDGPGRYQITRVASTLGAYPERRIRTFQVVVE